VFLILFSKGLTHNDKLIAAYGSIHYFCGIPPNKVLGTAGLE